MVGQIDISDSKILIVDDDLVYREVLKETFKKYKVVAAENGADGLTLSAQETPDIIILDIDMPDKDGYETCAAFRAQEATKTTPIIFYSSMNHSEGRIKAFDFGGNDYICKVNGQDEMLAKVEMMLNSEHERAAIQSDILASSTMLMNLQRETSRMHVVSQFLQACQYCHDNETLAVILLNSLKKLQTRGVIYFREDGKIYSTSKAFTKLEEEILKDSESFGRIHSFQGGRAIFNWHSMAVLVKDIGDMIDTIAYFMEAAQNSYRAISTQTKLIEQIIRIEAENRELRDRLASSSEGSKESLKERLFSSGLISRFDIQDEKDLDEILSPYDDDMTNFLHGMDNNSANIKRLLGSLSSPPDDLKEYFETAERPYRPDEGAGEVLF